MATWKYGAALRPIGFATVPAGYVRVEQHPAFRHGVVVYDHALTPADVESYQLMPRIPLPDVEDRIVQQLKEYADECLELYQEAAQQFEAIVGQAFERIHAYPAHGVFDREATSARVALKLRGAYGSGQRRHAKRRRAADQSACELAACGLRRRRATPLDRLAADLNRLTK